MRDAKLDPQKKPVKHFVPIFTGILEYLERGLISWSQFGLYVGIHLQADYSTGLWLGSAPRLLNSGQRGAKLREIQRDLDRLVQVGLLKHFHRQGTRGNFPWLINKFICRSGALTGMRLNADKSTCLEAIVYEACADDALTTHSFCADDGGLPSHLQEVKNLRSQKEEKKQKRGAAKSSAPDPEIKKLLLQLESELHGQLSGQGWWRKDQTEPELHEIREWFESKARDHGIDFRRIGDLYVETMARVREQLEPSELVCENPIGPLTAQRLQELIAQDPDCLGGEMNPDGSGWMLFKLGTQWISRDGEAVWHPFEDEPPQEKSPDVPEENLEHTGTSGTIGC